MNERGAAIPGCDQYSEERWTDFVLGRISPDKAAEMGRHLPDCPFCRSICEEWKELIVAFEEEPAPASAENAYPSPEIRLSLRKAVQLRGLKRRFIRSSVVWSSLAACAAVIVLLAQLFRTNSPPEQIGRFVELHEPAAVTVIRNPETAKYRVSTAANGIGNGYVWLNGRTQEALVLLEDLPAYDGRQDYQAWAISGTHYASMGLFIVDEGRAHLYVKGAFLSSIDNIAVSAEPKGGSLQPTTREQRIVFLPQP
jgi:anti-sigma-K factor RskA